MHHKKILVVGGGFAGIKAALELSKNNLFGVTLISEQSTFRYYPTLYHTVTGGSPSQSSIPLSAIFDGHNIELVTDQITRLDRATQHVQTTAGQKFHYDVLVLALGVVTNYYGIKGLETYSFSMKSLPAAEKLKQHLHDQLTDQRQPDLNYVIVGGGPTGIELAGMLPGYLKQLMKNHDIRNRRLHIDLVEAAPRLMPRMPRRMSRLISKRLRQLGVTLYLGQAVKGETADSLMLNGRDITSHTVIWTAGVTNHPFFTNNHFALNEHGKVKVDPYLQAEPNIFVLGDNADTPFSGMAQTAVYDGHYLANLLSRYQAGQAVEPYRPKTPIYVTPVGPHWAAVLWGKKQLFGRKGWWLREMADLIAFHDLEPWWKASLQWVKEFTSEEDCPICSVVSIK